MNKLLYIVSCLFLCVLLSSCGETKKIMRHNYTFRYKDNQALRARKPGDTTLRDRYYVYKLTQPIRSKVEEKTDYLIIKDDSSLIAGTPVDSLLVSPRQSKIAMKGIAYTTELSEPELVKYYKCFLYKDWKFALQTMTIPLKFRRALDDGTKYPKQVETGVNMGFAPVIKYTLNVYRPVEKMMGRSLNQYSLNVGAILNVGATDLKPTSNAPGLISERKAPVFTYGTFLLLGVNNINFGYAVGWDAIIGEGRSNWVYQNKLWHGVIIALDIVKP